MKIVYNDIEMDVDELRVDRYYLHVDSDTAWKLHSIETGIAGTTLDLELVNTHGDVLNTTQLTNMNMLLAKSGKFVEITKKEFENRKAR